MPYIYNLHRQKNIRRNLRNHATLGERRLWFWLRGRQLDGWKFRRQFGIRHWVVDFYCPALKLAIEVDGLPHQQYAEQRVHDQERQERLQGLGIHILRFTDSEVLGNCDAVLAEIRRVAGNRWAETGQSVRINPTTPDPASP